MDGAAMPADVVAEAAAAAGLYLRVAADAVLERCAASALALAEGFCGIDWVARPREAVLAATGDWQALPAAPVTRIDALAAVTAGGGRSALAVGSYAIDIDADGVGRVRVIAPGATIRIAVSYLAGRGGWGALPAPVAQGVVLLAVHLFEHREGEALPPAAVAALWRPFRQVRV